MLFMGEEWGASTPWQFFTDFEDPQLRDAVRSGRRAEFAAHGWAATEIPDPQDPATFERSTLRWDELKSDPHAELLEWHKALIHLRHTSADLNDPQLDHLTVTYDETAKWLVVRRSHTVTVVNLSQDPQRVPVSTRLDVMLASASGWSQVGDVLVLRGESVLIAQER
jgi:maltooligosyltrehalose trehalohydrolase